MTTPRYALAVATALLSLTFGGTAFAGDLAPRPMIFKGPIQSPPPPSGWTGFYIGVNGGYGWGRADWVTPPPSPFNVKGGMVGTQIGYNIQDAGFVWGLEADIDAAFIKGRETTVCGVPGCSTNLLWLGTTRGRVGYAFDNFLPYLTGGWALGGLDNSGANATESTVRLGWAAGAGVEYKFARRWSAKVEYLHTDLGRFTCVACFTGFPQEIKFRADLLRVGINRFF